jgi:hypothetical protein
LPIFFKVQFNFLYSGYRNEVGFNDVVGGSAIALTGGIVLLAFGAVAADAGLLVAFGIETAAGLFESTGLIDFVQGVLPSIDGFM